MIVLWLLILRGVSIEFRSHVAARIWASLWDAVFFASSLLLAVFYGAALGNVVRGVPLDSHGRFSSSRSGRIFFPVPNAGILDWYTMPVGVAALATLTLHGALWIALKTRGEVSARASQLASRVWWARRASHRRHHLRQLQTSAAAQCKASARGPGVSVFPILAIAGLAAYSGSAPRDETKSFLASCAYILGMLSSVAFSLYPYVLPSSTNPSVRPDRRFRHGPASVSASAWSGG